MPRKPSDDDPEGVETMSREELRVRLGLDTRTKLGWPMPTTTDPEGTQPPQADDPRAVNP